MGAVILPLMALYLVRLICVLNRGLSRFLRNAIVMP